MSDAISFREAEGLIGARSLKDPAFRAEFLKDPKAAIEKYSGQKLPANTKVYAHEITQDTVHFVLPPVPTKGADELSDDDLEKVAGGEFVIGIAVIGAITAIATAGVSVANDQTRSRGGW